MARSDIYFAAGVFVVAAGLAMGGPGGAVAVADSPSSDAAAQGDGGTNASAHDSATSGNLVGHVTDSLRETIRGVTSSFGSGRQPGQPISPGASPTIEPGSTGTKTRLVAAVPSAVAPVTDVTAPVSQVVGPISQVYAPVSQVVAPVAEVVAPVAEVVAPVPNVVAPAPNVVAPVPNVVAPAPNVVAPVPNVVAPVSDVIVAVQDMLTSVASSVVRLTQVPADLFSLLMPGIAGMEPVMTGSALSDGAGLSPTAGGASVAVDSAETLRAWQSPLGLQLAGIPSVPSARTDTTAVAPVDLIAAFASDSRVESSPPETAPPSSNATGPWSFLRDTFSRLPLPVAASLAALAAAALPGIGGLLILNAAGARIGYRQAKFGYAVHTSGIARFARPGPVGVVRSASLVFVRPRASRDGSLLDNAA